MEQNIGDMQYPTFVYAGVVCFQGWLSRGEEIAELTCESKV